MTRSACANVFTPITRSLPCGRLAGAATFALGHDEGVGAGVDRAERLLLDAADLAHVAVQVDLAGDGDAVAVAAGGGRSGCRRSRA